MPKQASIARSKQRRDPGRPKLEDVAEIDRQLLATALKVFLKVGYESASMTSIVQAAGVSKTTLYSRFPSKEALFRAIIGQQLERLDAAVKLQPLEASLGLEDGLKAYANRMLKETLQDGLAVNRLIVSESFRFPEVGTASAERGEVGILMIRDFIRDCAAADSVPCKDPKAAAEAYVFMIRGWVLDTMMTNTKLTDKVRERWVTRTIHTLLSARADW